MRRPETAQFPGIAVPLEPQILASRTFRPPLLPV